MPNVASQTPIQSTSSNEWVETHSWDEVNCIGVWDATFGIIPNLDYTKDSEVVKAALAVYHKEHGSMGRLKAAVRALDTE